MWTALLPTSLFGRWRDQLWLCRRGFFTQQCPHNGPGGLSDPVWKININYRRLTAGGDGQTLREMGNCFSRLSFLLLFCSPCLLRYNLRTSSLTSRAVTHSDYWDRSLDLTSPAVSSLGVLISLGLNYRDRKVVSRNSTNTARSRDADYEY